MNEHLPEGNFYPKAWSRRQFSTGIVATLGLLCLSAPERLYAAATCARTLTADVVTLDQVFFYNRLGAVNPAGMIFALAQDVVPISGTTLTAGNVKLRDDKRPRPLTLRMNVGDCLQVNFTNLLAPAPVDGEQPATRTASVHVMGMQLVGGIASDGSNVGTNGSSLAAPGGSATYTFHADREGEYLLYSTAATTGGEGDGGSLAAGLFGAVNVEPAGAEWYRSQVTANDLELARTDTNGGLPIIDYDAVYPVGHPREGLPIMKMLQGTQIVHSDLNAIITGPNRGNHSGYPANPAYPNRNQPFREFTVIFHDEIIAAQAFTLFEDPVFKHTLHGVRDGFAINYGSGGAGAEILANRLGVGPMKDCVECKYEEFFLTSWAVGDPAMVVDNPANSGFPATQALYPDDPSNVHHSYISDHVKFRNIHAGPKEHHIFHLHAHQWEHTPDSSNSAYLDSQAIGPGSGYTYEITYNGSGNRNKTPGDSIFHCHFYPHFAQGMWELWRVHDVFEDGTRKLPDGEIATGTPIPAVVPLPTLAMAPMPTATMPGYPFYIPGVAGHRPPHPPLDTVDDGGVPRHVITGGTALFPSASNANNPPDSGVFVANRLNFDKLIETAQAVPVPENGTPAEVAAMNFHAQRTHASFKPDGTAASFVTNGRPPAAGAPYADPCVDDAGNAVGNPRTYKAAAFQLDIKFNKVGWHYPQSRMLSLWGDVGDFQSGARPPEPFNFRANTNDCITYHHTNLVPNVFELDDYEVRTPTDIIGQHIHLVKFDVTASDGSGNGFNYEDGTFSPGEVIERINAINGIQNGGNGGTWNGAPGNLVVENHPFFGTSGAQTTVQRWLADAVLNNTGDDRTLRTVYTHDHFAPSTHQQVGLYAGLLIEPEGSTWRHSETEVPFYTRPDGGPTSWQAIIETDNVKDSYREFFFEFTDFGQAYEQPCGVGQCGPAHKPVNPPARAELGLPFLVGVAAQCPGGVPRPCPESIAADDPGTMYVNYRNEPIALRVRNPTTNTQAATLQGDLSHAYRSDITRADPVLNVQPNFYPPLTGGVQPRDPFTPLLRVYENDKVQIRIMVGANEEGHNFRIGGGLRWLFEPSDPNSGFKSSQMMGISEHFEFAIPQFPKNSNRPFADTLYQPGAASDDQWNGIWGILRSYNGLVGLQPDLATLPNNADGKAATFVNASQFSGICPTSAPARRFNVTATTAQQALPGGTLVYNSRTVNGGKLHDPTAILYVRSGDLNALGKLKAGVPIEPLVLRARAGDCITLKLTNKLPTTLTDQQGFSAMPLLVENFNANQVKPSNFVGLSPQHLALVALDDGVNIGNNAVRTASPGGGVITYKWYAGDVTVCEGGGPTAACVGKQDGTRVATPIEFGALNLISSDPIKHSQKGAIGGLIIEPQGSTWTEDTASRASATVKTAGGAFLFREFVLLTQDDVNLRNDAGAIPNTAEAEDPEDSGQKAFNYRSEPLWKRLGFTPNAVLGVTRTFDFTNALANSPVGGDPVTPVLTAKKGQAVRFRILEPGGHARNHVFQVHGHVWQEEPFTSNSTVIGNNPFSEWKGSQEGHGPTNALNVVLQNGAGGAFGVTGDYLYRDQASFQFDGGLWGIFRVTP
jgi:hypothetical protein